MNVAFSDTNGFLLMNVQENKLKILQKLGSTILSNYEDVDSIIVNRLVRINFVLVLQDVVQNRCLLVLVFKKFVS